MNIRKAEKIVDDGRREYLKKHPTGLERVKGKWKEKRKQHVDVVGLKSSEKNHQWLDCHFPAYFRRARIFARANPRSVSRGAQCSRTGHADEMKLWKIEKGISACTLFLSPRSGWLFVDAVKLMSSTGRKWERIAEISTWTWALIIRLSSGNPQGDSRNMRRQVVGWPRMRQ